MDIANAYAVVGGVIFGILLLLLLWLTQRSAVPSQLRSLRGKHVLITGGSTGIGFHIARRCAKEGAYLTLIARTPSKLEEARSLLTSFLSLPLDSVSLKVLGTPRVCNDLHKPVIFLSSRSEH
ncbi:hypothetical protein KP509_10G024400 [Ceratopteris richardii]|uniref:Uncharacterized protein n=1 Tax=Ceratopteris richardii TaxID=49495 RepID=A0A8T2TXI2_CERRI|nr:hypothetical protein KP509_10G024400 [Ceratopteris richardii]